MTINQRVKKIREALRMEQSDFAVLVGRKQGTISQIETGSAPVSDKFIKSLEGIGVNRIYIETGKGEMFNDISKALGKVNSNAKEVTHGNDSNNMILVPIKAFGGFLVGYEDPVFLSTLRRQPFLLLNSECFAFEVEGFSMFPKYSPGSYVVSTILEKLEYMQKGRSYVFQTTEGIILKQFEKISGEYCHVKSINQDFNPTKEIHLRKIKVVYFIEYTINKDEV